MRKLWIAIFIGTVFVAGVLAYLVFQSRWKPAETGPSSAAGELAERAVKKIDGVLTAGARSQRAAASAGGMNVPVDFWGQVIDQDNQPLAGVEVEGRALQWRLVPPVSVAGHHVTNHVVSDVAGRFEFRNLNGSSFTLDLTKQGYQLEPQGGGKLGVSYSNPGEERPNFDHPFIYKMWKLRGAEPTLKMDKDRRILCDGTPVFANLATGEIVLQQIPGLHLKVVVLRTPVFRSVGDEGKYDWQATVEVLGGGLQPSEDPFMYQAPVDGYQPRWQVAYLKDSPDWKDERVEKFFVRTREGNYARIQLKFLAWGDENRIGFSIVSVLNPAGSRNLEDGPLKQ